MFGTKNKEELKNMSENPDNKLDAKMELSSLLMTRFAHDITGPLGAISNGIEFALGEDEDPEIKKQALDLLRDSAAQALARLQLYRMAFGVVYLNSLDARIDELKTIFSSYFNGSNIEVSFVDGDSGSTSMYRRQYIAGVVLSFSKILIYGGKVVIDLGSEKSGKIKVSCETNKIKDPQTILEILTAKVPTVQPDVENATYLQINRNSNHLGVRSSFNIDVESEIKKIELVAEFPEKF